MTHVYEFEVFEGEEGLIALPYDLPGGTQGADMEDACVSAAAWLRTEMEHRTLRGLPCPRATFGNEPRHGGRTVVVAVDAEVGTVPRMSPGEAARALGVTHAEASRMVAARRLETVVDAGRVWVTAYSVEARRGELARRAAPRRKACPLDFGTCRRKGGGIQVRAIPLGPGGPDGRAAAGEGGAAGAGPGAGAGSGASAVSVRVVSPNTHGAS